MSVFGWIISLVIQIVSSGRGMRPPYTTIFDPDSTEEEVKDARQQVLEEIAEAQYERDEKTYFFDVWQNIEEAALAAWREDDHELYDYLKNNWEIMKLHAEQSGE
ncbi:MAG: hypothetical protein ABEJ72_03945 [Candidatus Aenigmatarchaeota archaeon]